MSDYLPLSVHEAAAYVIARKGQGYKEKGTKVYTLEERMLPYHK